MTKKAKHAKENMHFYNNLNSEYLLHIRISLRHKICKINNLYIKRFKIKRKFFARSSDIKNYICLMN